MKCGPRRWLFEMRWRRRLVCWRLGCWVRDRVGRRHPNPLLMVLSRAIAQSLYEYQVAAFRVLRFGTPAEIATATKQEVEQWHALAATLQRDPQDKNPQPPVN